MKKTITFLLSALFLITLSTSCEKEFDKDEYYKEAKRKHRFFRCKVNGKEWHNAGYGFYGDDSAIAYYDYTYSNPNRRGGLDIKMDYYTKNKDYEHIYIHMKNELKIGDNTIIPVGPSKIYKNYSTNPSKLYFIDTTYKNNLYIAEIDSINKIIAGEFEFRAINIMNSTDTVLVTDGEFDWKVYWYSWK